MELKQIRQFSEIDGVAKNPDSEQDGLFPKFNSTSGKFDYTLVGEGDIDIQYFQDFVTNTVGANTDNYLTTISQTQTGSTNSNYWASFLMKDSEAKILKLGRLAWLDNFETPTLPGDQKILFDNNGSIGGSSNFKYNYNSNTVFSTDTVFNFKISSENTFKEGVKYLGDYSFSFGGGNPNSKAGSKNILSGYNAGNSLRTGSENNVIYGPFAGEYTSSVLKNSIFIGPYAGRYETSDSKFYLDNTNYIDEADALANSFMYADLATERRLFIRDRLSVEKEGKFGSSGLSDANGEAGMFQMVADGELVKPQWHDSVQWQDFATGNNYYLQEIVEDVSTDGLWHFKVKDSTGTNVIEDLTLQLPILSDVEVPVAYTPSYPNITSSDYGYIQISNTSLGTNKGFSYKAGFRWDNSLGELSIPGSIKLSNKAGYTANNGTIRYDSTLGHFYGRINSTWKQLDNTDFTEITGTNIGGATYEWFKQKNSDGQLELRTLQSMSIDETYNPYDRITFKYSSDGDSVLIGTTAERNRLSTTIADETIDRMINKPNEGETLHIRALREGSNIVLTQTANYIQIDATTGGSATLMNGYNLGTIDFFSVRNGTNLEFFGLDSSDSRISLTQANGTTTFDNKIDLNLLITGGNNTVVNTKNYSGRLWSHTTGESSYNPTLIFRPIISDTISITETTEGELLMEVTTGSATNIGSGAKVYVDDTVPEMEFRTLTEGNHITITQNSNDINFNIDNIVLTNLGANTKLFSQGVDTFELIQKGMVGTNGLTITPSTNDITFSIPDIEKFELNAGNFVKSTSFSGTGATYSGTPSGTISFKLNHDDAINTNVSYSAKSIAELKIGGGLRYDSTNNILWNTIPEIPSDTNHYLQKITPDLESDPDNFVYTFEVVDSEGNYPTNYMGQTYPLSLTIPKSSVPTATYTNYSGSTGTKGLIKVEEFIAAWPLGNTVPLSLDAVTGKVSANKLIVTYEAQNNLHDADNVDETLALPPSTTLDVNTLRTNARANIGAAYVNGSTIEDFLSKNNTVSGKLSANSTSWTHEIGKLRIPGNTIYDSSAAKTMYLQNSVSSESKITLNSSIVRIELPTSGALEVYSKSGTKLMRLDSSGNLDIAGSLRANQDITAFDTDSTV